jgi:hypothetical protein
MKVYFVKTYFPVVCRIFLKLLTILTGTSAHIRNPGYSVGRDQEDHGSKPALEE